MLQRCEGGFRQSLGRKGLTPLWKRMPQVAPPQNIEESWQYHHQDSG